MLKILVGDPDTQRVSADYRDTFVQKIPFGPFPFTHSYTAPPVPSGGSWLALRRLILHHLAPRDKVPLNRIRVAQGLPSCDVRVRPLAIHKGTLERVEHVWQPLPGNSTCGELPLIPSREKAEPGAGPAGP